MKFGVQIKNARYSEWQENYIDYSGLKKFIKERLKQHPWEDSDEAAFVSRLESELTKIVEFQDQKVLDVTREIAEKDDEVKALIATGTPLSGPSRTASTTDVTAAESTSTTSQQRPSATAEGPNGYHDVERAVGEDTDDEDDEEQERNDRFIELEEDLASLIADVHDLGGFTRLNYTGFIKIVKKHDKQTGWNLQGTFVRQYLEKRPFYKENYDALIVQLSRLYNLVRTRGHPVTGDSSAGGSQANFVRQTTKYWVHEDNFVELKLLILKHLPVLVFNPDKKFDPADAAISSIYFDNESLDLYLGRLEKTEGAEAIRLRWYGDVTNKQIFVERKTHREDWTGEKSVKARFPLKEEKVNDYLRGDYVVTDDSEEIEALRKKGKNKEIAPMIKLAKEVQNSVQSKKLGPVIRTFYNRTAFQLPGDARVRISFDTELTFTREDNWDGKSRAGNNWRRTDIGIDAPFSQLPPDDRHKFPYGVLEVKLQTQYGSEPPQWVKDLVSSHLVEAVPKFSKFIHACSTLLPNRVDLVPFWLPQMDQDIRKPATQGRNVKIERPTHVSSNSASQSHSPVETPSRSDVGGPPEYTEPLSEDEDGHEDEDRLQNPAISEGDYTGLPAAAAEEARAFRLKKLENERAEGGATGSKTGRRGGVKPSDLVMRLTPANLQKMLSSDIEYRQNRGALNDTEEGTAAAPTDADVTGARDATGGSGITLKPGRVEYVSSFRAQAGKRISVPIRVEPKVYFANERTFLSWLEFSTLLGAIGVGLLNFARQNDDVAFAAATTFTVIALISILYAGGMFVYRALKIRAREAINYDDRYGPTALTLFLVLACVINIVMRYRAS